MVTVSFRIKDLSTNALLGVVGIDILIDTIRDNIVDFQLEDSHSHLIEGDGLVMSSPEWPTTSTSLFNVEDISQPPISESNWETIKNTKTGNLKINNYLTVFQNLVFGDKSYYYITMIPDATVKKVINKHQDSLNDDVAKLNNTTILILVIGFGAVLAFALIIVQCCMARPMKKAGNSLLNFGQAVATGELEDLRDALDNSIKDQRGQNGMFGNETTQLQYTVANTIHHQLNQDNNVNLSQFAPPAYEQVFQNQNFEKPTFHGGVAATPYVPGYPPNQIAPGASAPPSPQPQMGYPPSPQPPMTYPPQQMVYSPPNEKGGFNQYTNV